jgi:hypothetical protein
MDYFETLQEEEEDEILMVNKMTLLLFFGIRAKDFLAVTRLEHRMYIIKYTSTINALMM